MQNGGCDIIDAQYICQKGLFWTDSKTPDSPYEYFPKVLALYSDDYEKKKSNHHLHDQRKERVKNGNRQPTNLLPEEPNWLAFQFQLFYHIYDNNGHHVSWLTRRGGSIQARKEAKGVMCDAHHPGTHNHRVTFCFYVTYSLYPCPNDVYLKPSLAQKVGNEHPRI